ncbi:uncharacterized protein LY89DRAFT_782265 [Mollisia scopiformis]|uniref:Peptidase A2 domain-containing protein n=1 Tax=Mollisia scopiformis TaxID=149040 RepID=A0A194XA59_MOLSC|nr:uncharacterized protein LY89DRAFT_782265 [Mollisia scopiformis]KUJ17055.1 hypothetical protein LY89DRAFT_782265 [Mollisia scopiformis]
MTSSQCDRAESSISTMCGVGEAVCPSDSPAVQQQAVTRHISTADVECLQKLTIKGETNIAQECKGDCSSSTTRYDAAEPPPPHTPKDRSQSDNTDWLQQKLPLLKIDGSSSPATDDATDIRIAAEQSLGWIGRVKSNNTGRKIAASFSRMWPWLGIYHVSSGGLTSDLAEKLTGTANEKRPVEVSLSDGSYRQTRGKVERPDSSTQGTRFLLAPRLLGMVDADQMSIHSVQSEDSDSGDKYTVHVHMRDLNGNTWELVVLVDTGADRSFISRETLSKLGPFTERPIPESSRTTFSGPIGGNETQPRSYINANLAFQRIESGNIQVRLKIVEGTDKFQIIAGTDAIKAYKKKTGKSLLLLLEHYAASTEQPISAIGRHGIFALRSDKKSKKQEAIDEAYRAQTTQDKQNFQALKSLSSASSSSNSPRMVETSRTARTKEQTQDSASPNDDFRQSSRRDYEDFDWQSRRTGRTDSSLSQASQSSQFTQSTQFTQDSLSMRSTTSTWSSVSSVGSTVQEQKPSRPAPALMRQGLEKHFHEVADDCKLN